MRTVRIRFMGRSLLKRKGGPPSDLRGSDMERQCVSCGEWKETRPGQRIYARKFVLCRDCSERIKGVRRKYGLQETPEFHYDPYDYPPYEVY